MDTRGETEDDLRAQAETTCAGAGCPMSCRWRNYTPAVPCDVAPGGTWGRREHSGYWWCERYSPDLRPRDAKERKA